MKYVYCGNVTGQADESTYCPSCGAKLIGRTGYMICDVGIADDACPKCGERIEGVWKRNLST